MQWNILAQGQEPLMSSLVDVFMRISDIPNLISLSLPPSLSFGRGARQLCPVSPGGPELVPQEVPHLGGDPELPTSHPVFAGSGPLLRHAPAGSGRSGLQQPLLPQTLVALPGRGGQQRPRRLRALLRHHALPLPGERQRAAVRHEDSDQSGGPRSSRGRLADAAIDANLAASSP